MNLNTQRDYETGVETPTQKSYVNQNTIRQLVEVIQLDKLFMLSVAMNCADPKLMKLSFDIKTRKDFFATKEFEEMQKNHYDLMRSLLRRMGAVNPECCKIEEAPSFSFLPPKAETDKIFMMSLSNPYTNKTEKWILRVCKEVLEKAFATY